MPELPEVETIRNYLRKGIGDHPSLINERVARAEVLWERTVALPSAAEFEVRVRDQVIREIERRGKYLVFCLSSDALLIHLRMSGDLQILSPGQAGAQHDRLVLYFTNDLRLAFNDPRKFGRVWLVADPQTVLANLGPEPFDAALTAAGFHQALSSRHKQLKPLLLDQSFIAGLGNIYTDEALHLAHLHPLALSSSLHEQQSARLLASIRQVLSEGIRRHGASIDWVYRGGDFQNYFRVYQRTGLPCPECETPILRLEVGQRGTHICPTCQTLSA